MASLEPPSSRPGGRSITMQFSNPRRTPQKEMRVVGEGQKRQKLGHSPEKREIGAIYQPSRLTKAQTSTESGSDESASKWFEKQNKNVTSDGGGRGITDDEPPFYISNHANYVPRPSAPVGSDRVFGGTGGTVSRFDSENEDLRGVIDDLTVEIKRLRHLVRTQQHSHKGSPSVASQARQDRLFEVRMHGLPSEKRRELEFLLKNFAMSVHNSVQSRVPSTNASGSGGSSGGHAGHIKVVRTDSGYASNSNSGQNSTSQARSPVNRASKHKNVKNYLHDIPDTLLPKRSPILSERAKMALVVRRLEQLFTGRLAAPGEHTQPLQQQEVSQSAARADQTDEAQTNKKRKAEGTREARVMPPESKVNLDALDVPESKNKALAGQVKADAEGSDPSRSTSPDQRPTRPLDLDIHRAQVATENVQYIHHLGLSCPKLVGNKAGDESTWMFLNLLISMAQLHTLNVTPEFIRKAIKKLSRKFELSKDGHRVRWVGGPEGTVFSSEEEKALETADNVVEDCLEDGGTGHGDSKRSKSNSTSYAACTSATPSEDKTSGLPTSSNSKQQLSTLATSNLPSAPMARPTQVGSSFDYKPLVYKDRLRGVEGDSYLLDSNSSVDSVSRGSSGLAHVLSRSNLDQRSVDEGAITFYNNAFFCSDFSADQTPSNMRAAKEAIVGDTLGMDIPIDAEESPLRHHDACYYATRFAPRPYQPAEGDAEQLFVDVPDLTSIIEAGEAETVPTEMEVCGLGGVVPEDNFAVDVSVAMISARSGAGSRPLKSVPQTKSLVMSKYEYVTKLSHKIDLLPSKLPPPSYMFFTSSSSSDMPDMADVGDDSDDTSSEVSDEDCPAPPAFLRQFSGSSAGGAHEDDGNESSMDMLGEARLADPARVAEQEREYMINQPAVRPAAGSLAATVGTSSTSSPADTGIRSDESSVGDFYIGSDTGTDDEDEPERGE